MLINGVFYSLQEESGNADTGGANGADNASGTNAGATGGGNTGDTENTVATDASKNTDGGKPAEKTLMEQIGAGDKTATDNADKTKSNELTPEQKTLQAAEKDTRRPKSVPAKYWNTEKGEVNFEAWSKSTTELETRMRTVGLPPKTADEYKYEVPKELKDKGVDLDPGMNKAFREVSLALGLNQKQYEGVLNEYFKNLVTQSEQVNNFSQEKARTDLLAYYKTEEAMTENVRNAYRVFSAFADEKDMEMINQIGNIPAVIRVLSKIWPEMREDPGVSPDAILSGESLDHLMRGGPDKEDSPYWNTTDPRHKATVAKVSAHHEAQARARQRKAG